MRTLFRSNHSRIRAASSSLILRRHEPKAAAGVRPIPRSVAAFSRPRSTMSPLRMPSTPCRAPHTPVISLRRAASWTTPSRLALITWVQPPDWPTTSFPPTLLDLLIPHPRKTACTRFYPAGMNVATGHNDRHCNPHNFPLHSHRRAIEYSNSPTPMSEYAYVCRQPGCAEQPWIILLNRPREELRSSHAAKHGAGHILKTELDSSNSR